MDTLDKAARDFIAAIASNLVEQHPLLSDIRDTLEDGEALQCLGATDDDQPMVEHAHALVMSWIRADHSTLAIALEAERTMPRHDNGTLDARYSVTREYTGADVAQYVARFCGDWIGSAPTAQGASTLALEHARLRQEAMQ